jgi:hypothetical protein
MNVKHVHVQCRRSSRDFPNTRKAFTPAITLSQRVHCYAVFLICPITVADGEQVYVVPGSC